MKALPSSVVSSRLDLETGPYERTAAMFKFSLGTLTSMCFIRHNIGTNALNRYGESAWHQGFI